MVRNKLLALALVGLSGSMILASEQVGVQGSNTQFATPIVVNGQANEQFKLVLTGAALRKKLIFNVYTIASYVKEGVAVRSAEELAAADCAKRLHIVMERDVSGRDMAEAFRSAIRQNYAEPQFANEIAALVAIMQANEARTGDQVWLTHIPKTGLHIQIGGKANHMIGNPAFSQAVWDIYLGRNNLGDAIKKSLVSRL